MANLNIIQAPPDPTLLAIDIAMEEKSLLERPRPYLGMSSIGELCSRKLWYRFRWMGREKFNAETLKRFEDGHRSEDLQAERLRLVPGVILETVDAGTGRQFGYIDLDGHFRGHCDGKIEGIIQAPKKKHIWEHKSTAEKKFNELTKIKNELGEKRALRKWNPVYYAQALLYMFYEGYIRHYMTVSTPGVRNTQSLRTDADPAEALRLKAKAEMIIRTISPPERISGTPDYFECRWCNFSGICHDNGLPDRNCRTCLHSTPVENGEWNCARFGRKLTVDEQYAGCPAHKFLPALVPGRMIHVSDSAVTYRLHNGIDWVDGE